MLVKKNAIVLNAFSKQDKNNSLVSKLSVIVIGRVPDQLPDVPVRTAPSTASPEIAGAELGTGGRGGAGTTAVRSDSTVVLVPPLEVMTNRIANELPASAVATV